MRAPSKRHQPAAVAEADAAKPPSTPAQEPTNPAPQANARSVLDNLQESAPALVQRALRLAMAGDRKALFWCLNRIVPPAVSSDAALPRLDLPQVESPADVAAFTGRLLEALRQGEIGPEEARALAGVLDIHLRALGVADLDACVAKLERRKW